MLTSSAALVVGLATGPAAAAAVSVQPGSAPSASAIASSAAVASAAASDGRIAYVRRGQIVTMEPNGTDAVALTSDGRNSGPTWSPDGTRIAFVHGAHGHHDLWVMDADGSGKVAITTGGRVSTGGASWSPDAAQLAFGGPCTGAVDACNDYYDTHFALDTISSAAREGTPTTVVTTDGAALEVLDRVSWASTGTDLAFASTGFGSYPGDRFIVVYRLDSDAGRVIKMVGAGGTYGTLAYPAFNRDATQLAYDAYIYGQPDIIHRGISVCGYPVGSCDFRDVMHDSQLSFAPAGDRVVLVRALRRDRLVIASPDGTDRRTLGYGSQPSWQSVHAA